MSRVLAQLMIIPANTEGYAVKSRNINPNMELDFLFAGSLEECLRFIQGFYNPLVEVSADG